MAVGRDLLREELNAAVRSAIGTGAYERGIQEVESILSSTLRATKGVDRVVGLSGEEAAALLDMAIRTADERLRLASRTGCEPYRWLWYTRRLDGDLFDGDIASTGPYDRTLAETAVAIGQEDALPSTPVSSNGTFPIDTAVARRLVELCGRVKMISQLQRDYRMVGKGATLSIDLRGRPRLDLDADRERAIRDYDERQAASTDLLVSGVGQAVRMGAPKGDAPPLFLMGSPSKPFVMEVSLAEWDGTGAFPNKPPFMPVLVHHVPIVIEADDLYRAMAASALQSSDLWDVELPTLVAISLTTASILLRSPDNRANIMRTGYALVGTDAYVTLLDELLPDIRQSLTMKGVPFAERVPVTGAEVVASAQGMVGVTWPLLPGPVVFRVTPSKMGIDFVALSQRLRKRFVFPRETGAIGNARSEAFEISTQNVIDRSPWTPAERYRGYARRTLRRDGEAIGDIDAIGHSDGVLLLVSCKSYSYSLEYDTGAFTEVRRQESKLKKDIDDWMEFVRDVRANPRGDNFDLSGFESVVGLVVTPYLYYVSPPVCFEEALPGLRTYCSASELERWIGPAHS